MDTIEKHIRKIFDEIRAVAPQTNHFSLEITKFNKGNIDVWGFVLAGKNKCEMFRSIDELKQIVARKEILFRRFEL